ncbi:MAG: hypothetical protein AAB036_10280 [Elusimicrobiota bacterium]|mgnify:CR=1 FL=1
MDIKTALVLSGLLCGGLTAFSAQVAVAADVEARQVVKPLNDADLNKYRVILGTIDQGGVVVSQDLKWAKERVDVYVSAELTPMVNSAIEDYIHHKLIEKKDAAKEFNRLMEKMESNFKVQVLAKLSKAENR